MSVKLNVNLIKIVAWKTYFVFLIHLHDRSRGHSRTSNNRDEIISVGAGKLDNLCKVKFTLNIKLERIHFHIKYLNLFQQYFLFWLVDFIYYLISIDLVRLYYLIYSLKTISFEFSHNALWGTFLPPRTALSCNVSREKSTGPLININPILTRGYHD